MVDDQGQLIAVSFAGPADVGQDKFGYFIHLDEVRDFLRGGQNQPLLYVPDPWPPATHSALKDIDEDGVPDTLICGMTRMDQATGLLLDLDQNSKKDVKPEQIFENPEAWDFEFSVQRTPTLRAFYDTDNDGRIDAINLACDAAGTATRTLRLIDGKWNGKRASARQLIVDPSLIANKGQRVRLEKIMNKLQGR